MSGAARDAGDTAADAKEQVASAVTHDDSADRNGSRRRRDDRRQGQGCGGRRLRRRPRTRPNTVSAQAKEAYANAKDAADEGVTYVQARYRENRVSLIGVAIGALIAVGVIVRSIFRR